MSSTPYLIWNSILFITIYYSFLTGLFTIFIISLLDPALARTIPFNMVNHIANIIFPIIDMLLIRWRVERIDEEERILSHV